MGGSVDRVYEPDRRRTLRIRRAELPGARHSGDQGNAYGMWRTGEAESAGRVGLGASVGRDLAVRLEDPVTGATGINAHGHDRR